MIEIAIFSPMLLIVLGLLIRQDIKEKKTGVFDNGK